jgi:hypothetical protein
MTATTQRIQCSQIIDNCGRRYRCTRPAAKKHDYKYCGHCAPRPSKCGMSGSHPIHREDCAGCTLPCCRNRSLCTAQCRVYGHVFQRGELVSYDGRSLYVVHVHTEYGTVDLARQFGPTPDLQRIDPLRIERVGS